MCVYGRVCLSVVWLCVVLDVLCVFFVWYVWSLYFFLLAVYVPLFFCLLLSLCCVLSLCTVHLLCVVCEPSSLCVSLRVADMFVFGVPGIFHEWTICTVSLCVPVFCVCMCIISWHPRKTIYCCQRTGLGGCPSGDSAWQHPSHQFLLGRAWLYVGMPQCCLSFTHLALLGAHHLAPNKLHMEVYYCL